MPPEPAPSPAPLPLNLAAAPHERPANFTRQSPDLFARLAQEKRYLWIPLLRFLRRSDFAREGMDHSGSFRFADHLYRNKPSGKGRLGRWLDALLLALPSSRSMRQRYLQAGAAMQRAFQAHLACGRPEEFRLLTVPCGLPREVRDFAARVAQTDPAAPGRLQYTGLDLDPAVIAAAREFLTGSAVPTPQWILGNALRPEAYPAQPSHFIASTGLGEFLDDRDLAIFYENVFRALAPGGVFFTSAAARGRGSAVLLELVELKAHYRTRAELAPILARQNWASVEFTRDKIGLQTFVRAVKA